MKLLSSKVLKYLRLTHRYVSFFCTGILALYLISGFMLNHQREFTFLRQKIKYSQTYSGQLPQDFTDYDAKCLLAGIDIDSTLYRKHSVKGDIIEINGTSQLKVSVSRSSGIVEVTKIHRPPFLTALNKLHRNPNKVWTYFSDISLVLLIILVLTGLFIVPGKKGLWGIGGVLLLIGILIPVIIYIIF